MKFSDIPQFPRANYVVDVPFDHFQHQLKQWDERPHSPLILNPDFQRGHVWTEEQKISYIEYFFKGGTTGRDIYFNCSSWGRSYNTPVYCVDGLQRITAALDFLENKIKVFGHFRSEYEDRPRMVYSTFRFNMLNIKNKRELLKIYHNFNSGGTPHSKEEMLRIEKMISETAENETL